MKKIQAPLTKETVEDLKAGDRVLISGTLITGRDAAHQRLFELMKKGEKLPVEVEGQVIYYVGPTPARPGEVIGSAGPTTSGRMDAYAPDMMKIGLKGMIGKGARDEKVKKAMVEYKAVYFGTIGGAGAIISGKIKKSEIIAYEDLGPEAIRKLTVEDFPAVVINDAYGGDLYKTGKEKFAKK